MWLLTPGSFPKNDLWSRGAQPRRCSSRGLLGLLGSPLQAWLAAAAACKRKNLGRWQFRCTLKSCCDWPPRLSFAAELWYF